MGYPERKPIYEAYESIVINIVESKAFKEYAENEIKELDNALLEAFKQIQGKLLSNKKWPSANL
jgi:hypothetical protein